MVILFLAAVRHHRSQKIFLLLASYYFYACWDWRFLSLIWLSTLVDYFAGRGMGRTELRPRRQWLLTASIGCNLVILGIFKYFNFFVDSFAALIEPYGLSPGSLNIILPVGISFYTFQSMSYTIDVYRRKIPVCRDSIDFALFVAFFPQLVAGPIVRASQFLPQLKTPRHIHWDGVLIGFRLFALGYLKKVLIADRLAIFVDGAFDNAGSLSGATLWLAVLCWSVQIYCDFSGYSDMAIGAGRIMGYELSVNFRHPYIATSLADFWHRWHISLSTWLRDYLYIPLGGNRYGRLRTAVNLMITMVLGGLWHGAAWTFVFWGALHGVAMVIERLLTGRTRPASAHGRPTAARLVLGWIVTMLVVNVAWVFFRSTSLARAVDMLGRMFLLADGAGWFSPFAFFVLLLVAITHGFYASSLSQRYQLLPHRAWYTPVVLLAMMIIVQLLQERDYTPFIYFQF